MSRVGVLHESICALRIQYTFDIRWPRTITEEKLKARQQLGGMAAEILIAVRNDLIEYIIQEGSRTLGPDAFKLGVEERTLKAAEAAQGAEVVRVSDSQHATSVHETSTRVEESGELAGETRNARATSEISGEPTEES